MSYCDICGAEIGINRYSIGKGRWICPKCSHLLDSKKVGFFERRRLSTDDLKAKIMPQINSERIAIDLAQNRIQQFLRKNPTKIDDFFWFSEKDDLFAIPEQQFIGGLFNGKKEVVDVRVYKISNVIGYKVIEDGITISKGGLGRAFVGGILFGEVGAVVGAITGEKKENKKVTELRIDIEMNDTATPLVTLSMFTKGLVMSTDNMTYTYYLENLRKIASTINVFLKRNESKDCGVVLDKFEQVKKYKDLLDSGIITQEEYDKKRKELLEL